MAAGITFSVSECSLPYFYGTLLCVCVCVYVSYYRLQMADVSGGSVFVSSWACTEGAGHADVKHVCVFVSRLPVILPASWFRH